MQIMKGFCLARRVGPSLGHFIEAEEAIEEGNDRRLMTKAIFMT